MTNNTKPKQKRAKRGTGRAKTRRIAFWLTESDLDFVNEYFDNSNETKQDFLYNVIMEHVKNKMLGEKRNDK